MLSLKDAERIRTERKLNFERFSIFLGFSANAYREALRRGRLSGWMAERISQRCGVKLDGEK